MLACQNNKQITYLNSQTSWVKLASSVEASIAKLRSLGIPSTRNGSKLAKENIQALNVYYNPANVDRIVKAGNIAVSTALERAKADPYTNHNKFINPE